NPGAMMNLKLACLPLLLAAGAQGAPGFTVSKNAAGAWNFTGPDGKPFFVKACAVVIPKDGAVKPGAPGYDVLGKFKGGKAAWAKRATARLKRHGFNSLGAWSDDALYGEGLVVTHTLALAG